VAGEKDIDYDNETWDDYDVRKDGDHWDFVDNSDYEDGFMWSCCKAEMDDAGCKRRRHQPKW